MILLYAYLFMRKASRKTGLAIILLSAAVALFSCGKPIFPVEDNPRRGAVIIGADALINLQDVYLGRSVKNASGGWNLKVDGREYSFVNSAVIHAIADLMKN